MNPKHNNMIAGSWLLRVLHGARNIYYCADCGSKMFVKTKSGLCPVCFTHQEDWKLFAGNIEKN